MKDLYQKETFVNITKGTRFVIVRNYRFEFCGTEDDYNKVILAVREALGHDSFTARSDRDKPFR